MTFDRPARRARARRVLAYWAEFLSRAGISRVEIYYAGENDEGDVERVVWGGRGAGHQLTPIFEPLLCRQAMRLPPGGWEINAGSAGIVQLEPGAAEPVRLSHEWAPDPEDDDG